MNEAPMAGKSAEQKRAMRDWSSPEDAVAAYEEIRVWPSEPPDNQHRYFALFDEARLAGKIARAACGTSDPALIAYLMQRMHEPKSPSIELQSLIESATSALHSLVDHYDRDDE
jgi:hypothetical protein